MDIEDTTEIEVPAYFICPISLEIMRDPVTVITGITYDRESIERWLFDTVDRSTTPHCPVTNQLLPRDSELTPNHTLRRLIQSWCSHKGIDRIPTPRTPLDRFRAFNHLIVTGPGDLNDASDRISGTLRRVESLAAENERNRKHMADAGTPAAVISYVVACFDGSRIAGLKEAVSILNLVRVPPAEARALLLANDRVIDALSWVLQCGKENHIESTAVFAVLSVLKRLIDAASSFTLGRLKPNFFGAILGIVRSQRKDLARQGLNTALKIMRGTCCCGRNRLLMVRTNRTLYNI